MHDDDDGPLGSPILDFEAEGHRFRCYFADRVVAMRPADGPEAKPSNGRWYVQIDDEPELPADLPFQDDHADPAALRAAVLEWWRDGARRGLWGT